MSKTKIKIQTAFATGKEDYVDVEIEQPYMTGIIDPPWPYTAAPGTSSYAKVKKEDKDGEKGKLSGFIVNKESSQDQYSVLSCENMSKLPIGDLIGGYLLLWCVSPFIANGKALEMVKAWGFDPITFLYWGKYDVENKHGYGGVGYWVLGNCEPVLIAKKPGMPSIRTGWSSLFLEKKKKHSAKPSNIHTLCEDRFPGPYVEIFGRYGKVDFPKKDSKIETVDFGSVPSKWTALGNQAPGDGKDISVSIVDAINGWKPEIQKEK